MPLRSVSMGPSAIHESGHFYFAQTGHSHFAATLRYQSLPVVDATAQTSNNVDPYINEGTLGRVPLGGGAAREVLEKVEWADWSPDGSSLAVVREEAGQSRIEFPIGKVLYQTGGWISHPRISPKGDLVAFLDHPLRRDDAGSVAIVDLSGKSRILSTGYETAWGLAWSASGDEIWKQ